MKELYYKFPLQYEKLMQGKDLQKVTLEESMADFIQMIIATTFGEYKYDEDFGTIIWETDFSMLTNPNWLKDLIKQSVFEKIKQYEKRIDVTEVTIGIIEDTLSASHHIRVKKRIDIMVYGIVKLTNENYYFRSSYYLAPFSS
jgi:phage baseplate assembly protein W